MSGELDDIRRRLQRIEEHLSLATPQFVPEPMARFDPIDRVGVPPNVIEAMVKAVPDAMVREIVQERKR